MDRTLDEIVYDHYRGGYGGRRGGRKNERNDFPRDGIRKSTRDEPRNLDSEWVHDKFEDNAVRRPRPARRHTPEPIRDTGMTKLRVENLHYDLTEDDLDDLFNRIGPVVKLTLLYDRAGRSEGVAFVTYESAPDAKRAIREFDGANANGQPIRLILVPNGPTGARRNPFDTAVQPSRPLADRITLAPSMRSRSFSPVRHSDVSGPAPANVDRYVPGKGSRSRSPMPRRREGRPPGLRRDRGERGGRRRDAGPIGKDGRPKKTQEELDAEMEDYWAGGKEDDNAGVIAVSAEPDGDIDMAE